VTKITQPPAIGEIWPEAEGRLWIRNLGKRTLLARAVPAETTHYGHSGFNFRVPESRYGRRCPPYGLLDSDVKGSAAMRAAAKASRDTTGNLPSLPGIYPDSMAPVVIKAEYERRHDTLQIVARGNKTDSI